MKSNLFAVFVVSASALALAACSGGGGGNGISGGGPVVTPPAPPVTVNITGVTALGPAGNNPLEATGPTPNFTTSNNLPPNGTVFPLNQGAITITSSSATGTYAGAGYATIQGTVTTGGVLYPLLDLKVPALGINVTGLRGDGTAKTQADGASVSAAVASLNYTLLGSWSYKRTGNNGTVLGLVVSGYQTPAGSVPATGTASYVGIGGLNSGATAGGVVGSVAVPGSNGSINAATLSGDVNLNVNFATRQANGTLSNMVAKDVITGTTSPWNNVTLSGNLSHAEWDTANPGAVITGTTHAQSAPLGATFGMSSTATGNLNGALYGPNASEVGALWSVNEGSGATGKTAFGFFGATKQ